MMVAHVIISGFVHGVGFRRFVKNKAKKLGLFGWIRNLPDGRVDALLQGKKETIGEIILLCKKGPFLSEVKDVRVNFEDTKITYDSFDIIP